MSDKIQREIEWSDSSDGPQREATHNSPPPRRKFLPVQGQELTMNARAFLGRHIESKDGGRGKHRSEEHTSELQSRQYLVCRLLLEKKKKKKKTIKNKIYI